MLKFVYKQKIRERVNAKCQRHPRYNPELDGREGIKVVVLRVGSSLIYFRREFGWIRPSMNLFVALCRGRRRVRFAARRSRPELTDLFRALR